MLGGGTEQQQRQPVALGVQALIQNWLPTAKASAKPSADVLGARLLESTKKVGETAEAIELRQSGENSILGNLTLSVSASLTQVLAWAYWWNSTEATPDDVSTDDVVVELNTDFSTKGMSAQELTSVVSAWQRGALSRDSMLDLFRRGEILPEGRTNEEETKLIDAEKVSRPPAAETPSTLF